MALEKEVQPYKRSVGYLLQQVPRIWLTLIMLIIDQP